MSEIERVWNAVDVMSALSPVSAPVPSSALPVISVEYFGSVGNDYTKDTAAWQAAINFTGARGGGRVVGGLPAYLLNSLSVPFDNVELDFGGSVLTVDLRTTLTSFITAAGAQSTFFNFLPCAYGSQTITVTVPGVAANYSPGDPIHLTDKVSVVPWNHGLVTPEGTTVTGRSELNYVASISGDVITLDKPTEWDYNNVSSPASQPQIAKVIPRKGFKVWGIKKITEVDPGGQFMGDTQTGPHLIRAYLCDRPIIKDIAADGFQLHVVEVSQCFKPYVENIDTRNPFRPQFGGHGYSIRFDGCRGAIAINNSGIGPRHHIDVSSSHDTGSASNVCFAAAVSAYKTHGTGTRRYVSLGDKHIGGPNSTGWDVGDDTYAADYDVLIVNPEQKGGRFGVKHSSTSRGLTVRGGLFEGVLYDIAVYGGAIDTVIEDNTFINLPGKFDQANVISGVAQPGNNILCRQKVNLTDTYFVNSRDMRVRRNTFLTDAGDSQQVLVKIDCNGTIEITSNDIRVDVQTNVTGFSVSEVIVPEHIFYEKNKYVGTVTSGRSVRIFQAPFTTYLFKDNVDVGGARTGAMRIILGNKLQCINNDVGTGTYLLDGTFATVLQAGAIFKGNRPLTGAIPPEGSWPNPIRLGTGGSLWAQAAGTPLMLKAGWPSSDTDGTAQA